MPVLALCPTRGRPNAAAATLASFQATAVDPASRLVFIVDADDPELEAYRLIPDAVLHVIAPTGTMGGALTVAGRDQGLLGDASSVGMIGDDNRFRTRAWDVILDSWLVDHGGLAYGDDGFQHERLPTSWWIARPWVDAFGIVWPELRHYWMDNWWLELGRGAGAVRYFPDVSIEHLHPLAGKASADAIYQRGELNGRGDQQRFQAWLHNGRRADVARAVAILGRSVPRRVLADWHHPALWESLSILFEDRLGWQLYATGGRDWTKRGWSIGFDAIGWDPARYLEPPGMVDRGTHLEAIDREYPDRPRKLVTVEQAESQAWDVVLASVPGHQQPFAQLARRVGATFVHQIGNARHPIDRSIPQIVLASALLPRQPGPRSRVIPYHQEFSRELFAPSPAPADRLAVSSLMLRLDTTSGPFDWIAAADGVTWRAPGGRNPDDGAYLAPMAKVADVLRSSAWIWHDKLIGDGYGHVLWNAMAVGRPLIGHRSHYAGLLGEPLFADLETAIDLDRHGPRDALRLIRAIAADPEWYAELVARCQAKFAELVDFDAEADRIAAALD